MVLFVAQHLLSALDRLGRVGREGSRHGTRGMDGLRRVELITFKYGWHSVSVLFFLCFRAILACLLALHVFC